MKHTEVIFIKDMNRYLLKTDFYIINLLNDIQNLVFLNKIRRLMQAIKKKGLIKNQ